VYGLLESGPLVDGVLTQLRRTQGILDDLHESLKARAAPRAAPRRAAHVFRARPPGRRAVAVPQAARTRGGAEALAQGPQAVPTITRAQRLEAGFVWFCSMRVISSDTNTKTKPPHPRILPPQVFDLKLRHMRDDIAAIEASNNSLERQSRNNAALLAALDRRAGGRGGGATRRRPLRAC
jgi:hypothetical protein